MKSSADVVKLAVRVRRTLKSADSSSRSLLAYCPVQHGSRSIDCCRECERCEGLSMGAEGISHVLCRVEDPPPSSRKVMPTAAEVTRVGTLIKRDVVCVSGSLGCAEAMTLFLERGISGAPVVDDEGRPLGMLTRSDLLRAAIDGATRAPVAATMMPIAFVLEENDPLSRAAALMAVEGVQHLPVIGDYGRVVGMVSAFDITRWLARQSGYEV
jgi:CBS domain-containing protein